MKDYFKYDEIKSYFNDFLAEDSGIDGERNDFLATHDSDFRDELHHHAFNTDYFIIGTYKAKQWLGDKAFDAIDIIKDYEESEFGEVTTDLGSPESVVNMYAYIVGEEIVYQWLEANPLEEVEA
tara:strand:+ start:6175 stop:6546 length:372 start_codon:yes stop_codon:yes gene_type:complete